MSHVKTKEEANAEAQRREVERLKELSDIRMVMSSLEGRRFVWRFLAECRVFLSTYSPEALESYYRQGRRSVGLLFYNDVLEACPEQFWQAQRENIKTEGNPNG
ncbi:MAG: hypothetical protein AB7E51_15105 [Pseudodesulfovibrio sp.]|uniref:Bbp19 family protein n=1 Tax=Pseudodesulfovibrio sp. TaxID=2035812 RepID=UPI003D13716A